MGRQLTAADRVPEVGDVMTTAGAQRGFRVVRVNAEAPRFWVDGWDGHALLTETRCFSRVSYVSRADGGNVNVEEDI